MKFQNTNLVSFNAREKAFLLANEVCRLATCHDNTPHVVPVSYVFENSIFYFATDLKTRKLENIMKNYRVAIVVDEFVGSADNKAVCVQGKAEIIENGQEFERLYRIFHEKFSWVRRDPWNEGEAPFIRVIPANKTSWGL